MYSTLKNSYLESGTILGMKANDINIELSNINGNSVYYHDNGKTKLIYSDTDVDKCLNKFILGCEITDCKYVNLSSGPYVHAYIDIKENILHMNNNCKKLLNKNITEIKVYCNDYNVFKRSNLICIDCYEPVFYRL